jgi:ligand-binding sensor domain-containing protein/signal transduction histidine kinase
MRFVSSIAAALTFCAATQAMAQTAPSIAAASQHYLVDRWTVEDGLPNNSLSGVMHARDGYLWVASLAGVWRFDGVRFTPIAIALPNAHVRVLLEDRRGTLWIGSVGSGLVRVTGGRVDVIPSARLAGSDVRVIAEDAAGRVWVGTESGASVIEGDRISNFTKADGIPGDSVDSLVPGDGDAMWIGADAGICEIRGLAFRCGGSTGAPTSAAATVPGRVLKTVVQESVRTEGSLLRDRAGRLWIGGTGGLFSMNEDFAPSGACARGCFSGRAVTSLLESRSGQIFAGFAAGGVGVVDDGTLEEYGTAEGMAAGPVVSLAEDAEGSVWVAIYNGGLERLRRKRLRMFTTADGLPAKVAGSIVEDTRGTIWAGSQCGPVSEFVGGRFVPRFIEYTKGLCALSLMAARDGSLWIGTDGGVFHWANGRMTSFGAGSGLTDLRIRALFESRDGAVWIGTLFGGLYIYQDGALSRSYGPADGVVDGQLESFAQDRDGRVWIGSNGNGLSVYENSRFRLLGDLEQPPERDITGMLVDRRGDFWVSTDRAGFFRHRPGRRGSSWEPFGVTQGLGDSLVGLMLEDRDGNFWVSTTRGISRIERAAIDAVADGRRQTLDPILIDRFDGLLNPEVSGGGFDPTGLVDRNGRLWFSTIDGIATIDPSDFRINDVAPRLAIESATVGGTATELVESHLSIPAGGPPVELSYTGLSFLSPKKMRFRYRLAGFDHDWTEAGGRRTAYYPHLPPGRFTFEVLAANADGVWSPAPATLVVTVAPYWWERASVRVVAALFGMFIVGLVVRSYTLRRAAARVRELEREHELDRERRRIAQDLHDDIGARLTQLALMADRGPDAGAGMAAAARDTIQAMDELVWMVNAKNDTAESVVTYCAAYADEYLRAARVRLRLNLPVGVPPATVEAETRRQVFLCLKEALNNVVKHSGATEVHLSVEVGGGEMRFEISDNGRGFALSQPSATGNGLGGMRARAEAVGGQCEIASDPGAGTRVHIHVPLDDRKS